jgi:hypothetical protein
VYGAPVNNTTSSGRGLWGRKKYQPMSFGGKIWKGEEKKGETVKEKGRKGKEKRGKGKENEKRGSKRVK